MILRLEDVSKSYDGHRALDGLSLDTPDAVRCLALVGPSGGGKSTLLRLLGGLELPDAGILEINGQPLPVDEPALRQHRRQNGFLFQSYSLFPHLTAQENITLPLEKVFGFSRDEARRAARENLERFGLVEHADKHPQQLSGGQQQRVALVRAITIRPRLLLLDEPTAALDPEMTVEVLELVREVILEGQDVILCTHEMGFARAVADRVAFVAAGKVVESSRPEQFFTQPASEQARRFLSRVLAFH
jgi:polar amino acid transport system ATP-binding protein